MGKFSLDVRAFAEKAKKNPETVMRAVSIKLFSAVIKSSPVDTGRFRMNWQPGGPSPATGVIPGFDLTGNKAISAVVNFVNSSAQWQEFTLSNNQPYAHRLEYGWSKQAPTGIVRVNVLRFQQLLDQEAAKVR